MSGFQYVQTDTGIVVNVYKQWHVVRRAKIFLKRGGKWNRSWLKFVAGKIKNKIVTLCLGSATRQEIYAWRLMTNGQFALATSILAEAMTARLSQDKCYALIQFGFALFEKAKDNFIQFLDQFTLLIT